VCVLTAGIILIAPDNIEAAITVYMGCVGHAIISIINTGHQYRQEAALCIWAIERVWV